MKVTLSQYCALGNSSYEVDDQITCELNGTTVEVRQSTDGKCMVVAIKGKVSMEPRAAAIWLVVK